MSLNPEPIVPTTVYTVAWAAWVGWFVFWELLALLDPGPDDTLTEHIRPLLHSTVTGYVIAAIFLAWLAFHFLLDGR